ncbi:MAG TPA: nucleoside hydrolase [Magnetospirillaceae bacterium]|jgi:inosine-uridine nucleoside N-ribohydrolase
MARQKVIFDTDPGVDDAMALLYIDRCGALDLLGVTTVQGNSDIDTVTRNALYMKQRFGLKCPVARGAEQPLKRRRGESVSHIHGHNGLGDAPVPEKLDVTEDGRPAWQFIIDTVRANPGEVTLIAVGRMTNLALALQHDPEITKLVKAVSIMGGAFGINGHSGNVTPVAEANIIGDPEAADIVTTADWDVTMIGLDVTHETIMTPDYLRTLQQKGGEIGQFFWDITRGYEGFYRERVGLAGIACHDSLAVAYVVDPSLFTTREGPIRVVTEGLALGQTIQKYQNRKFRIDEWDNHPSQKMCVTVDSKRFLDHYMAVFAK